MCGILFSLTTTDKLVSVWSTLLQLNTNRGPDAQDVYALQLADRSIYLRFFSSVLHLRGPKTMRQPIVSENVLCWNGEVFGGLPVGFGENDTKVVMEAFKRAATVEELLATISLIEGPFAFVYFEKEKERLWFGRDCLGRRSLLWRRSKGEGEDESFILSSVGTPEGGSDAIWEEVPADAVFCIQFGRSTIPENVAFKVCGYPVERYAWAHESGVPPVLPFPRVNQELPSTEFDAPVQNVAVDPLTDHRAQKIVNDFMNVLDDAVKRRVADVPFLDNGHSAARIAILFSGGLDCVCLAALAHRHLPLLEPIDLLNVAFENPRSEQAKSKLKVVAEDANSKYDTPDRLTGRASVAELRQITPGRTWNFVEINVPYGEAMMHQREIIDRMHPLDTVMDLSIAMALWFAARGKGVICTEQGQESYVSRARVLLSGLGADEQLGGYSRHREAFRHGGWDHLIKEIQLDVDRIWKRNLGRDDRIISDHGKEARFPYLSTEVVNHLCRLPIHVKMDLRYGRGVGEKLLLRQLAIHLGLKQASCNWKRAIQFGAKTAKMTGETRAEKGQHKISFRRDTDN